MPISRIKSYDRHYKWVAHNRKLRLILAKRAYFPPTKFPRDPRREPSPCCFDPEPGAQASIRPANLENGRLWSHTLPGPVSFAKNNPSPPNSMVLIPPACIISKSTVDVMAARHPVSTCNTSPGVRLISLTAPPTCMNTQPSPSIFCMINPSPPKKACQDFLFERKCQF